ncbi:MAG: protoheme IX farnesyltransferase [Flavobacteriaceae bacterium]|nr:protoheme IX farnesyltransferase [Flavobacteriaceae bacterium]|tara:strand:+ start:17923 stop:18753 length:831 start_codon:yes stop_codon:yes gene_type:complete
MRLALSVVFSSLAGYFLAAEIINWNSVFLLFIGGYAMVGASNVYNQLLEKNKDSLMKRTLNRPLPANRMTYIQALIIAILLTIIGVTSLYFLNLKTAVFGTIAIIIYVFGYTPLKSLTPLSVFIGAIPGAIPYMLGWVAYSGNFGIEPGVLFMFQFFWQFPHFWAIGWMLDEDYKKAGFKMLPTGKKDTATAFQIVFYSVWTIVISLLPISSYTGSLSLSFMGGLVVLLLGLFFLFFGIRLMKNRDDSSAKNLMYASIFYITFVQIIYIMDKIIII